MENIIGGGYRGVVTPVNREGGVVCSRAVARSLAELDDAVELAIISADGEAMLEAAAEAAAGGAKALLVVPPAAEEPDHRTSGAQDERLLEIVRGAGLRLVGPDSLGVINTAPGVRLNATFSSAGVAAGGLAICTQAGAPGFGALAHLAAKHLGLSTLASLGSCADVSTNDLLEYWEDDERTSSVMLYVDRLDNPEHFTRIAQRVSRRKPILAIKARPRRIPAVREARSHTAAALRGEAVEDALLQQAGVLRVHRVEELFDAALFFARQPLPRGRRIGIVANSGGLATLAADACAARRLEVTRATDADNPLILGLGAGPEQYTASIRRLLGDPRIDAVMAFYVELFDHPEAILEAICASSVGQPKPVVASVVRSDGRLPEPDRSSVPNFLFPESCADVLSRGAQRREWLSRRLGQRPEYSDLHPLTARELISLILDRKPAGGWLTLAQAEAVLATYGIPVVASYRCTELERGLAVAAEIGGPVAVKANFAPPAHASDIDAVLLGLEGESALRAGWRELEERVKAVGREWTGAIIQPLVPGGADVLVGAIVDPDLGSVLAVGLGGRQAGLGHTAAFRLPPATDVEADELIDSSESLSTQLDGFRGSAVLDRQSLRELILRFALLLHHVPEIVEADLNPVRCMTTGAIVLDMRLRIEHRRPLERVKTW